MPSECWGDICRAIQKDLPGIIGSINELNNLFKSLSPQQSAVVCEVIKDYLLEKILSAAAFRAVLKDLSPEQVSVIYEAMKAKLPEMINNTSAFHDVFKYLSTDQRVAVYQSVEKCLLGMINHVSQFLIVTKSLPPQLCQVVCERQNNLSTIIRNADDLQQVFQGQSYQKNLLIISEAMKAYLPDMIKNLDDFLNILPWLSPDQCGAVCAAIKDRLPKIFMNMTIEDFRHVLGSFSHAQCVAVCVGMEKILLPHLVSVSDFRIILEDLSEKKCAAVCTVMKDSLLKIVNSPASFGALLQGFPAKQSVAVCAVMQDSLPTIIQNSTDLKQVLEYLSPEQCEVVCAAMQGSLPTIIKDAYDLAHLFCELPPEKITVICGAMKEHLPAVFERNTNDVLYFLSSEQAKVLCVAIKDSLPQIINSAWHLKMLVKLHESHAAAVCFAMLDNLPLIIKDAKDFKTVFKILRQYVPEGCYNFYAALMKDNRLLSMIKNAHDFYRVLEFLSPEKRTIVYEGKKNNLPPMNSVEDFQEVLQWLSPDQCAAVCEAVKNDLPNILKNADDFQTVIQYLSPDQCAAVCEAVKNYLPKVVKNADELLRLFEWLSPDQAKTVWGVIKKNLPGIIKNIVEFKQLLNLFSPEQYGEENLSEIINKVDDLKYIFKPQGPLSLDQCVAVCIAMKNSVPKIIGNADDFKPLLQSFPAEQQAVILSKMKMSSLLSIRNIDDIEVVFWWLKVFPEQRNVVYEKLREIIKNAEGFRRVIDLMSPEECSNFCLVMKDKLPEIIKSSSDFDRVFFPLASAKQIIIYKEVKDNLQRIVKTVVDFTTVIRRLTPTQLKEVLPTLKDRLPNLINNIYDSRFIVRFVMNFSLAQGTALLKAIVGKITNVNDFFSLLELFSPEQCTAALVAMKISLPRLTKDIAGIVGLETLLSCFSFESCLAICKEVINCLPAIVKDVADFKSLFNKFSPAQRIAACAALKDNLLPMIKHVDDFLAVLKWSDDAGYQKDIFDLIKGTLPRVVKSSYDFNKVFKYLTEEQRDEAFKLPILYIYSPTCLTNVLDPLSPRHCTFVCGAIKDLIPSTFYSSLSFGFTISKLTSAQCLAVCLGMKENLWLKNSKDLRSMLNELSPEQSLTVCQGIQERLCQVTTLDQLVQYFAYDSDKREAEQLFFASLLQEARMNALKFDDEHDNKAKDAVNRLSVALEAASKAYFPVPTQENYEVFQKNCKQAIDTARDELKNYRGWEDFFAKLFLTIVSLGVISAALAIVSKVETGNWEFRLFKTPGDKKLGEISEFVTRVAPTQGC